MELDLSQLETRHAHDLLTSSMIPRPIAWVSSVNAQGQANLAPFSFFTGVSYAPPVVAFSVMNRTDGTEKDTLVNIRQVGEFVIHIVSVELLHSMEETAKPIPYGTDAQTVGGIHLVPAKTVKPCRIEEAKIAFECTLEQIVRVGEGACAGNLVLGRVRIAHFEDGLLKNEREVDCARLDALGRLSGNRYCTIRDVIESETN